MLTAQQPVQYPTIFLNSGSESQDYQHVVHTAATPTLSGVTTPRLAAFSPAPLLDRGPFVGAKPAPVQVAPTAQPASLGPSCGTFSSFSGLYTIPWNRETVGTNAISCGTKEFHLSEPDFRMQASGKCCGTVVTGWLPSPMEGCGFGTLPLSHGPHPATPDSPPSFPPVVASASHLATPVYPSSGWSSSDVSEDSWVLMPSRYPGQNLVASVLRFVAPSSAQSADLQLFPGAVPHATLSDERRHSGDVSSEVPAGSRNGLVKQVLPGVYSLAEAAHFAAYPPSVDTPTRKKRHASVSAEGPPSSRKRTPKASGQRGKDGQMSAAKTYSPRPSQVVGKFYCGFEDCSAVFETKSACTQHEMQHVGKPVFPCPYKDCTASFTQQSTLGYHVRMHTGEKPYKCEFAGCNSTFRLRSGLTVHERTHTGERPYPCTASGCQQAFRTSSHLTRHMQTHHRR